MTTEAATDGDMRQTTDWRAIVTVLAAGLLAAFQIGKAPAALPTIRAALDLPLFTAGWVISIIAFIGASSAIAMGALGDRIGHRRALLGGIGLLATGSLLGGLSGGITGLLVSRVVEGVGFITVAVMAPGIVLRLARPKDAGLVIGVWGTHMSGGVATVMLIAPLLLERWGWQGFWLANSLALLLVLPLTAWGTASLPRHPRGDRHPLAAGVVAVLRRPGTLVLGASFICYTINYFAIAGFLPTFLIEQLGYSTRTALPLVALIVACNALGSLAASALLHRGANPLAVSIAGHCLLGGFSIGIFAMELPEIARGILAMLALFSGAMVPISVLASAPRLAPTPRLIATTNGLFLQGGNIGQLIGPPLLGALVSATGSWRSAPALIVASALGGVLLVLLAGNRMGRQPAT